MKEYKLKNILEQKKLNIHVEQTDISDSFEIHTHDFCELVFVVSGKGTHRVGNQDYQMKKGDIFVLKGNEKHGFSGMEHLKIFNIMFNVYDLQAADCKDLIGFWVLFVHEQPFDFLSHMNVKGEDYDLILWWCTQLLQEYTDAQPGYISVCKSVLMQMIVFLSRLYQTKEPQDGIDYRLAKAVVYMQTNFADQISVEQLARLSGFSERHFSRLFQELYGMSPIRFLNKIRLDHARVLLESEEYRVIDAAALCGFGDSNYFCRIFKKQYGCAPSDWKKMKNENLS